MGLKLIPPWGIMPPPSLEGFPDLYRYSRVLYEDPLFDCIRLDLGNMEDLEREYLEEFCGGKPWQ